MFKSHLVSVSLSISLALLATVACGPEATTDGTDPSVSTDVDEDLDTLARKPKPIPDAGTDSSVRACSRETAATDCDDQNACTKDSCVKNKCRYEAILNCGAVVGALPVNLGTAGGYVVLAKSGISTVPNSNITGNLGLSPAAASNATGFSLILDATGEFSRSTQINAPFAFFGADYAVPTPSKLTTAVSDMELAFTNAAGRAPDYTEVGAGNIGGLTLTAGVYKWGTGVIIPSNVTLTGSDTDVFIFQIAGTLVESGSKQVILAGGVAPKNVFWQVSGLVDIGTSASFSGVVLTKTAITVKTGASVNGRLLAQTAVALQKATVTQPAP